MSPSYVFIRLYCTKSVCAVCALCEGVNPGEATILNVSRWCTSIFVCRRWNCQDRLRIPFDWEAAAPQGGSSVCTVFGSFPQRATHPCQSCSAWSSGLRPQWRCCTNGTLGWIGEKGRCQQVRLVWSLPSCTPAHLHTYGRPTIAGAAYSAWALQLAGLQS